MKAWRQEMKELFVHLERWHSKQRPTPLFQKVLLGMLLLGAITTLMFMLLYR